MLELEARSTLLPDQIGAASDAGVHCRELQSISLVTVLARKGAVAEARELAKTNFRLTLPEKAARAGDAELCFVGLSPESWLASSETLPPTELMGQLSSCFGERASLVDQSSGYTVLRLTGERLRETLAKGVPLDLHPAVFPEGSAATTIIAHMGAILWRNPDFDGLPVFDIAAFRSHSGSFMNWLSSSAAEFGFSFGSSISAN